MSTPLAKPVGIIRILLLAATLSGTMWAGSYNQSFSSFSTGTTELNDGSSIDTTDSLASTASVQSIGSSTRVLRLTTAGRYNTISSFKLPDLDPGGVITSFDATWKVVMTKNGSENPGEGWSLSFGKISAGSGYGERGFAMASGLAIGFDPKDNTQDYTVEGFQPAFTDPPSIQVLAGGVPVGNVLKSLPFTSASNSNLCSVQAHWDSNGLDLKYDFNHDGDFGDPGEQVFANLATPYFKPAAGDTFAFSAATTDPDEGVLTSEGVVIDDIVITTTTAAVTTPEETGGPVISEFVAENSELEDENADKNEDWIEIYNGQNASVDLTGWRLTDTPLDLALWTFPGVVLGPYEYRIIHASSNNRIDPAGPLHTNFSLKKSGEYLALVRPDDSIASEYVFGPQDTNVSYGIAGNPPVEGYFYPATPGAPNTSPQATGRPAELPVWSHEGGLITEGLEVSIADPVTAGAVVRYTTDNSVPTDNSPVYSEPFTIAASTTLRARVFAPDQLPGPVVSRSFLLLGSSVTNYNGSGEVFSSTLPILVLDSFGTPVDAAWDPRLPRPPRFTSAVVIDTGVTGRASLIDPPAYQGRSGTHIRGNSSSTLFHQRPYALETWDEEDNDQNVSLLGMPADSDWVLYSPFIERSLLRDFIFYSQIRAFTAEDGRAMRARYVEVFFNQAAGQPIETNAYQGIYLLVEKVKIDKNRVDLEKLNDQTTDPAMITGGYMLRHDWEDPLVDSFTTPGGDGNPGVTLQSYEPERLNDVQFDYVESYFEGFESALYGPDFDDPQTGYADYIDADSFIDNEWFVEIARQADGFVRSTYFSKDRGGKLRSVPAWDYDLSSGNVEDPAEAPTSGWFSETTGALDYKYYYWYPRLHEDPNYEQRHWDRYWMMRRGAFSTSALTGLIDSTVSILLDGSTTSVTNNMSPLPPLLENAVMRHFRKWPTLGTPIWPLPPGYSSRTKFNGGSTTTGEVNFLKNWITKRLKWIDDQNFTGSVIYRPPNFSQYGDTIPGNFSLTISRYTGTAPSGYSYATGGTLYYTLDGSDPRLPGGSISSSALAYSAPVVINESTTVKARLYKSGVWSPVSDSTFIQSAAPANASNLVIAEIHYHPTDPTLEEDYGGFTNANMFEFIELHNISTEVIDLFGCNFTDGITFDFGTANHAELILPPGGRLVLSNNPDALRFRHGGLDGVTIIGPYGGNLENGGELLTLLAADTSVIASFIYDDAEPWAVDADGAGYSLVLDNPAAGPDYAAATSWRSSAVFDGSPGGANGAVFGGLPDGDGDGDGDSDFLEYAVGSNAASAASRHAPVATISPFTIDLVTANYLEFSYLRNLSADGLSYEVQFTDDISAWESGPSAGTYVGTVNNGDGTATVTWRSTNPFDESHPRMFVRLKVSP